MQSNNRPQVLTHQIMDMQHRMSVGSLDAPVGWQSESQVNWNYQHTSSPVKVFARLFDEQAGHSIEFFPVEQYFWLQPNFGFPQQDLGNQPVPPMPAADALTRVVLPKYRGAVPFKINSVKPFPDLARRLQYTQNGGEVEGVSLRGEYIFRGKQVEEEFLALKFAFPGVPSYGSGGCIMQYNWGFARLFSFLAPKGQLDSVQGLFWSIVQSFKINPQWEQLCNQVIQQMQVQFNQYLQAGYSNIQAATQMSQQITAQNEAWLNSQEQQRQAAYQREHQQFPTAYGAFTNQDAFGDMMMGRETMNDPYYEYGSQQSGYAERVFTDGQGNYKQINDPNEDPNINSSVQWTLMTKKNVGEK